VTVVSAFLIPGSPLPYLRADNPPWRPIADGLKAAGAALKAGSFKSAKVHAYGPVYGNGATVVELRPN
jgi:hypothetical protein